MKVLLKFGRWLFWNIWYLPQPRPRKLDVLFKRWERTWWPWRKFKPYLHHSDIGHFWEIVFEDAQDCTWDEVIEVRAQRACAEDNRIVSLKISDSQLGPVSQEVLIASLAMRRVFARPEILDEIRNRLENETPVAWDDEPSDW